MAIGKTYATRDMDLSATIGANLPFLRRYARALTGNQTTGDRYAAATLEAILADQFDYPLTISPRVALFRAFHVIWSSAGAPVAEDDSNILEHRAQMHMRGLTRDSREALLLHTIEGFDLADLGEVLQTSAEKALALMDDMRIATAFLSAPDADLHSVGQQNFEWVVEAAANMAIARAKAQKPGQDNLTWGTFVHPTAAKATAPKAAAKPAAKAATLAKAPAAKKPAAPKKPTKGAA